MPSRIVITLLAAAVLAGPAAASAAAARPVEVRVSAYGVQRWSIEHAEYTQPDSCYDDRGHYTEHTVGRFHTTRSVRMRLEDGLLAPVALRGWTFERVDATFVHGVSGTREVKEDNCTDWKPFPLTTAGKPCRGPASPVAAALVNDGDGIVRFFGGIDGRADQLPECDWGDRSGALYEAKGRLPLGRLRAGEEVELKLRGRTFEDASTPDTSGTTTTRTRTTVYLKLRPVG